MRGRENLAKRPSLTWAYEQFGKARDDLRKGLHKQALLALNRAINGHGSDIVYDTEYRFHYVKGLLLSGFPGNWCKDVIDLTAAEQSFYMAAQCARVDFPKEAAKAYLGASWAATYCGGRTKAAIQYISAALTHDSNNLEYLFSLAKYLMHSDLPDKAQIPLEAAIRGNKFYSLEANSLMQIFRNIFHI